MPLCFFAKVHFYDHNGKCACGRRATQDENLKEKKMTQDIRVGDKIYATPKDGDVTVSGTVFGVAAGNKTPGSVVVNLGGITIGTANWDISVTERPFQLPTEGGLYTIASDNAGLNRCRVYILRGGRWREFGSLERIENADLATIVKTYGWTLKRLVIGEVAS